MNSQHPRWKLPPTHHELLRSVLAGPSGTVVTPEQRAAIREICSAPERGRFEPEDFLIAFKLAIVEAASAAGIPLGPDRNELLARLVTVYIQEFYGRTSADEQAAAPESGRSTRDGHGRNGLTSFDGAHTSADVRPSA